ncbi:hypothetical protein L1887_14971 [Cichorium endivia]|nr:hypothetical protein L1887_14971 [Cichorium endivia]
MQPPSSLLDQLANYPVRDLEFIRSFHFRSALSITFAELLFNIQQKKLAEMEVDGDPLPTGPTQHTGSSNASVNATPTTESAEKVVEEKRRKNRKQKGVTKETFSEV